MTCLPQPRKEHHQWRQSNRDEAKCDTFEFVRKRKKITSGHGRQLQEECQSDYISLKVSTLSKTKISLSTLPKRTVMIVTLLLASFFIVTVSASGTEQQAQKHAAEEEAKKQARMANALKKRKQQADENNTGVARKLSQHAQLLDETYVDLHGSDLDLGNVDPKEAASRIMKKIGASVEEHMAEIFEKAKTAECRALIGEHFGHFVNAIGQESAMPFADIVFQNECDEPKPDFDNLPEGMHFGHIQLREYQPPRNETHYIDDPMNLRLCYGIMTHDNPASTIRLIETLYEPGYVFVIHVDGKEQSDEAYNELVNYASQHSDYVHIVPNEKRVRVIWGGFSMVNATLQILRHAFALDDPKRSPLSFHKFVHMASTSYPVVSNTEIRRKLSSYPLDANMLNVIMKPIDPHNSLWSYFVECDDAVHRIYRLGPLVEKKGKGIDIYTASQWFIASREFAKYIAEAVPGTIAHSLIEYMKHVVVADESFFGTLLRHSPFCRKHHNSNFLHLHFDRWENEEENAKRDERKCIFRDRERCGRSPTTLTMDYIHDMELSDILFARKFDDEVDPEIKDVLDAKRAKEEEIYKSMTSDEIKPIELNLSFEGHGVLIVAKDTVSDDTPLCLGLGQKGNEVGLVPCFHEWVPGTLAPDWESGAVIIEETFVTNQWKIGPCSSDGDLRRNASNGDIDVTPGNYTPNGPMCILEQMDGPAKGRCLDSDSFREQPGGTMHINPCLKRWQQFFSFGSGSLTPHRTITHILPKYMIKRFELLGHTQEQNMCIGVAGRGNNDPEEWEVDENEGDESEGEQEDGDGIDDEEMEATPKKHKEEEYLESGFAPLRNFIMEPLVTTPCSNTGGVIEWVFVPYIEEENDTKTEEEPDTYIEHDAHIDPNLLDVSESDETCKESDGINS